MRSRSSVLLRDIPKTAAKETTNFGCSWNFNRVYEDRGGGGGGGNIRSRDAFGPISRHENN